MDWREEGEDRRIRGGVIYLGSAMAYAHSEHVKFVKTQILPKLTTSNTFSDLSSAVEHKTCPSALAAMQ